MPFGFRRSLALAALLACASFASASAQNPAPIASFPKPPAVLYPELVASAQNGNTAIDYTLLRLSYPFSENYDPFGRSSEEAFRDAFQAFNVNDCATALEKTDEVLAIDFTRIAIHSLREECLEQTGEHDKAGAEQAIVRGLTESLLAKADGKTEATAYLIVTIAEERFVLASLGVTETNQSLVSNNNRMYDSITGTIQRSGDTARLSFDVSLVFVGQNLQRQRRYNGRWVADIPMQGTCPAAQWIVDVKDGMIAGTLTNPTGSAPIAGRIDSTGMGVLKIVQFNGTIAFNDTAFEADFANACGQLHASGMRASN